jgi:hypothetical protein
MDFLERWRKKDSFVHIISIWAAIPPKTRKYAISSSRICRVFGLARSTFDCKEHPRDDSEVANHLIGVSMEIALHTSFSKTLNSSLIKVITPR